MLLVSSFPSKNKQDIRSKILSFITKRAIPQLGKCKHFNLAKPCRTVYIQSEELHFRSNIAIVHLLQIAVDNIKNGVTTLSAQHFQNQNLGTCTFPISWDQSVFQFISF